MPLWHTSFIITSTLSECFLDNDEWFFSLFSSGHTNFVLASLENPASVSPYRVNTSYRRPAGGDSDHGYSTMTPHEDSEHASIPCLDPFSIGKDRFRPPNSLSKTPALPPPPHSSTRRSRSPTPPQTRLPSSVYSPIPEQTILPQRSSLVPEQTVLPTSATHIPERGSRNILANVTVHMVDSHWHITWHVLNMTLCQNMTFWTILITFISSHIHSFTSPKSSAHSIHIIIH